MLQMCALPIFSFLFFFFFNDTATTEIYTLSLHDALPIWVASFDRKIRQASDKLDVVHEREERFRIVEKELIVQRDRLAQDRLKAEKYQRLKGELQLRTQ